VRSDFVADPKLARVLSRWFGGFEVIDKPGQGNPVHFPDVPNGKTEIKALTFGVSHMNHFASESDQTVPQCHGDFENFAGVNREAAPEFHPF